MGAIVNPTVRSLLSPIPRATPGETIGGKPLSAPFTLASLNTGGRTIYFYDAAAEGSMFTDIAGTTVAAAENDVIARVNDLSGNGINGTRVSPTLRPKLGLITANGSYRRAVDYDGVDDTLNFPFPNLGTNCTLARARPGIGMVFATGQTISGALNDNTDWAALVVSSTPFTAQETADLKKWGDLRAGMGDQLNQSYGTDPDEVCDVFHSGGHPNRPIIVMVHGGGWRNGGKGSPNVTKNKLQHWLPKGYTFVSVNYPMAVGTSPIDQARSVAKCIAWVQSQARSWGCKPSQLVLMGHSAGGHLVGLVSVHGGIRAAAGVGSWLGTVCIDSAGYDLVEIMGHSHLSLYDEPWSGGSAQWIAGSPTYVLNDPAVGVLPPPMLCITSTDTNPDESDPNVGPFKDLVLAKGGYAEILQTDFVHADTNINLGLNVGTAPIAYTAAVDAWLLAHCNLA